VSSKRKREFLDSTGMPSSLAIHLTPAHAPQQSRRS
jgi:hypothetical protein